MGRIGDWINRQRHNRGYGIQSPSSFFFVTQVLKERLPYYAYPMLETIATEEGVPAKKLKELFRITNHHKPANCIAIGSPAAACAMTTARPSVVKHCITDNCDCCEKPGVGFWALVVQGIATSIDALSVGLTISEYNFTEALLASYDCQIRNGDLLEQLKITLEEVGEVGMLYIGRSPQHAELLKEALPYTNENSIIVIEGIHGLNEKLTSAIPSDDSTKAWWQTLIDNPATIITYDLYHIGILLFNKERIKQHYTLKR